MAFLTRRSGVNLPGAGKPPVWRARRGWFALLQMLLGLAVHCHAAEPLLSSTEKELKVAFLYNFALYTEWPVPLGEGLHLCVLGRDELGAALEALNTRAIHGKPLVLRRLDARADVAGCHMVYIAGASEAKSVKTMADLRQKPILSIKDAASAEFALISLGRDGNRLVFDVNNTAAHALGVTLSSKLLRLARQVR